MRVLAMAWSKHLDWSKKKPESEKSMSLQYQWLRIQPGGSVHKSSLSSKTVKPKPGLAKNIDLFFLLSDT